MSNLFRKKTGYLIFIIAGLIYSFFQHYSTPLDGDMVGVVLPTATYQKVLEAPLGFSAIFEGERYAATNRYFIHQTMYRYFNSVPIILQKLVNPISSVYASAGLFKLLLQIFLLWLFSTYTTTILKQRDQSLLATLLFFPLFQHSTYNAYIGLISGSITYTFFYTFPLALLFWFFLPYFKIFISEEKNLSKVKKWTLPFMLFGIIYLSFSGPLIAPLVLLIAPVVIIGLILKKNKTTTFDLNLSILIMFLFLLLAFYSFYLGTFNLENSEEVSILKRYKLLPFGLFYQLTNRPALPLLLGFIFGNIWWIKRGQLNSVSHQILKLSKLILLFSIIFILILPLGGYREYRPYILRMDTLMPINFILFILYGVSSLFIFNSQDRKGKKIYGGILLIFSLIFLNANCSDFNENSCERNALERIATEDAQKIRLKESCKILSWEVIKTPEKSYDNAEMLKRWKVTDKVKLYYFE